jgi:glycosyltransferase involved in cell wall biosynthesis
VREGLPRVVVQYIAGGVPAVVAHLPGIEEVIRDGVNGVVVGSGDVTTAVQAIRSLLTQPALLTKLTEGARHSDVSSWGLEQLGYRNQAVYASLDGIQAA